MTVVLRAEGVCASYGNGDLTTRVLDQVGLTVRTGEVSLLMGPSGSGKTTLLSILAGLQRPSAGEVEVCGRVLTTMSEAQIGALRRSSVGFVFQTHNLFPALDALSNVALAFQMRGERPVIARERAAEALAQVGLADRMLHRPAELSGGQRQRVAIARALAGDPALVLGDEITASLDGAHAMAIMDLLRQRVSPRSAALIVTHDMRLVRYATRVWHLDEGRLSEASGRGVSG